MTAQQRSDQQRTAQQRSDRRIAESAPVYAARERPAVRRRTRGESLAAVIERRRAVLLRLADS